MKSVLTPTTPGLIHEVSEAFDAGTTSSTSVDSATVAALPMAAVRHAVVNAPDRTICATVNRPVP